MKKIAIVHDQLMEFGGAERVLVALIDLYPKADIYTSFYDEERLGIHKKFFSGKKIHTSWAQKIPFLKSLYSPLRFITPLIWESLDLSAYDVVISSSGSYMCKGIITRPETKHICYIHHPPRYLYYYETAIEWQKHWPVRVYGNIINHGLRMWDYLSSRRVDLFVANSQETRSRVRKLYRMDAQVVYPPVEIAEHASRPESKKEYYITVSRLARAKHLDVLVRAAGATGIHLKIVGVGRDLERLKSIAGPTVEFCENVEDAKLHELYAGAKAYLFASVDEEFGIAPVEAVGHSLPVIAFNSGGLRETVRPAHNGYLYNDLTPESLAEKIKKLESLTAQEYKKMCINARTESLKYTQEIFSKKMSQLVMGT